MITVLAVALLAIFAGAAVAFGIEAGSALRRRWWGIAVVALLITGAALVCAYGMAVEAARWGARPGQHEVPMSTQTENCQCVCWWTDDALSEAQP